jgi:hypothetical protein
LEFGVRTVTRISQARGGSGMTNAVSAKLVTGFPSTLAEAMARPVTVLHWKRGVSAH